MGCDIHLFVEKYYKNNEVIGWQIVSGENKVFGEIEKSYDWLYMGRNYDLFAILADVRNGLGVAGIDTGDGFIPIDEPRGLPVDVSPELETIANEWSSDGHSHSYFTLKELKEYDWTRETYIRAKIDLKHYERFKKGENVPMFGGRGGQNIVDITEEQAENLTKNPENIDENKKYNVLVEWRESYRSCTEDFHSQVIPKLEELAEGDEESVRIVFFFDN